MKKCVMCQIQKCLIDFPKNKRNKDGLNNRCKKCINLVNKLYRINNIDKVKLSRKKYYNQHLEKIRKEKRLYCKLNKEQKRNYDKHYRSKNKTKISKYKKIWEFNQRNNPIFKIKRNLRRRINHALKDNYKSVSTMLLLGCNIEYFKSYLESLFEPGMSWDNYGINGWHIDHIKPCYLFDLSDPTQQKLCFHYSNQRPLWAKDNLSRTKLDYYNHFQKDI